MTSSRRGWIVWFAHNPVAANLLMIAILLSGIYAVTRVLAYEVFPDIALDSISIGGSYAGASAEEVEKQITVEVENAIQDLEFVESIFSRSIEGQSSVRLELTPGTDKNTAKSEIQSRIEALKFNSDIETPSVSLTQHNWEVISLSLSGESDIRTLRELAERMRNHVLSLEGITQVELGPIPQYELSIEVAPDTLRRYGLTLKNIAEAISQHSGNFAAGNLKTVGGEILLRTVGQANTAQDFDKLLIRGSSTGQSLRLGEIATIRDGFREDAVINRFNGEAAILLEIYQVNDQSSIAIAKKIRDLAANPPAWLPQNIGLNYWRDRSAILQTRLDTLVRNAIQGAALVFLLLSLFLRPSIAFWVTIGIPVSFMGAFALMPVQDVSVNLISLFAYIVVLGIVVDDAIVTGENIYAHAQRGKTGIAAAIDGTKEVTVPVTFGVLTTVVAFVPLFFFPGYRGQIFAQIPAIVIPVLLFSLVESKLILPAHLSRIDINKRPSAAPLRFLDWLQRKVAHNLEKGLNNIYRPMLTFSLKYRYAVVAFFIGALIIAITAIQSGHMRFIYMPKIPDETAKATITMPSGSSLRATSEAIERVTAAAEQLRQAFTLSDERSVVLNILSVTEQDGGYVTVEVMPPEHRPENQVSSVEIVEHWRGLVGSIPGVESVTYLADIGRAGDPINLQFEDLDLETLKAATEVARTRLGRFDVLSDIQDTFSNAKSELSIALKPGAEMQGVTVREIADQVRTAFYGLEVQTLQRGNNAVDVILRLPLKNRQRLSDLEELLIPSRDGFVPLRYVATLTQSKGNTTLYRTDQRRTANVMADADKKRADLEAIKRELRIWISDEFAKQFPSVKVSLVGEAQEQKETFASMKTNAMAALLGVYVLLAIPFRSYIQPFLVMAVIPFGIIGALLGHMIMGLTLSIMSMMGILALTGVIVNDSLVLVDFVNRRIKALPVTDHNSSDESDSGSWSLHNAIKEAGVSRFRPVLLTSLTTFIGLTPLLLDKSTQAQFLIPMAVSLGFGILFATVITLILVPCNYLIIEDLSRLFRNRPRRANSPFKN